MSYPGNPSLSADVQQRIRGTFEHTLTLASSGNRQEAVLGCEFVLRMDPSFEPARQLQERLAGSSGPVAVDDLRALLDGRPAPRPSAPPSGGAGAAGVFGGAGADDLFSDLDPDSLPVFDDLFGDASPANPSNTGGIVGEFQRLLDERRFQELLNRARQETAELTRNLELRRLAELAEERLEAGPYVNKFLSSVREMLLKGDRAEAERLLDKARSLDSSHPGIAEAATVLAAMAPAHPPSAGAAGAAGGGIDFGAAALSSAPGFSLPGTPGSGQDEPRIRELLGEGQAALERGDPQGAIDVWSRIFLIDIDHQEASRRIEGARRQKAERERQVEEIFHDGVGRLDAKDLAGARHAFEQVLVLQPEHLGAREYLEQLRGGGAVPGVGTGFPRLPELPAESGADLLGPEIGRGGGELREEILIPPDPVKAKGGAAAKGKAPRRPGDSAAAQRRFILIGAAVLLLAAAVGLYLWLYRDTLFPNSATEAVQTAPPAGGPDPIARAKALHANGKTPIALAQLKRLPSTAPQYAEAQKLIAEWEAATTAPVAPPVPGEAPSAEAAARRQALLAEARNAFADRRYLRAEERFQEAGRIAPIDGQDAEQSTEARRQLEPIVRLIALVRKENEWEIALPDLWRMYQADPSNRDLQQLIVDSYYNLAVRDLQRNDAPKAVESLNEALKVDATDDEVKRRLAFAQAYQHRPKDLLYRIYVKYLPSR